jgi:short-subunit dehydrogenase
MTSTVLITGASQGIGKETAFLFARHGYNVVLAARNSDRLETVAREIEAIGISALAIPTDVKDAQQVENLVQMALNKYSTIDILVNNAGIYISGLAESFTLEDWHQAIDTNLWGYIHTIHFLLPHFLARGSGMIINVDSIGGKVAVPYLAPYATSKFAVTGLTKSLHSELAPKGIHVAGIYPNLIDSDFMERAIFRGKDAKDTEIRRQQVEKILQLPAIEKPKDVADAIWQAVKHKKSEVVVGSAKLSVASQKLFPGLTQWIARKTFKNQDFAQN